VHGHKFVGVINFDIPSAMSVTRWRGIVLVCHAIDMKGQPDMLDELIILLY